MRANLSMAEITTGLRGGIEASFLLGWPTSFVLKEGGATHSPHEGDIRPARGAIKVRPCGFLHVGLANSVLTDDIHL